MLLMRLLVPWVHFFLPADAWFCSTLRERERNVGLMIALYERERRWVLLKIPRCDIDGVGEGK